MGRPRKTPISNPSLARVIDETRKTYGAIASAVNKVGAENGVALSCTGAALGQWLNGAVPVPVTRAAVVEALARLADRPDLSATDLGWPEPAVPPANPWRGDPVAMAITLGTHDMMNRRTTLTTGLWSIAAAAVPKLPGHLITTPVLRPGGRRAGASDVARIHSACQMFGALDDLHGGGHGRAAAAAYYVTEVAPLLHGTPGGPVRPRLFSAAAEVLYLLGWMAADDGCAGLSQRYYIGAVRLADEAGDHEMRSAAFRSLAAQAVELGHAGAALALASAAQDSLRPGSTARRRAWTNGMAGEAQAATGFNRARARHLLQAAEKDLNRADSLGDSHSVGGYHQESYEHQQGLALTQWGDHVGAEKHFAASVATRRPTERRTRALIGVRLAAAQLHQRHPDEAAATIMSLRDDLTAVRSARVAHQVARIRTSWVAYRSEERVQEAEHALTNIYGRTGRRARPPR
ncbi:hypothetical protein [Actinomadura oligospora]|uniref:hypothetical protein n=1 Tax=Actinomadura oligospora TaxID=111804 RepID=UPI0004BA4CEF|nr:hypothetical protein [Actinomadura oligospora]